MESCFNGGITEVVPIVEREGDCGKSEYGRRRLYNIYKEMEITRE